MLRLAILINTMSLYTIRLADVPPFRRMARNRLFSGIEGLEERLSKQFTFWQSEIFKKIWRVHGETTEIVPEVTALPLIAATRIWCSAKHYPYGRSADETSSVVSPAVRTGGQSKTPSSIPPTSAFNRKSVIRQILCNNAPNTK